MTTPCALVATDLVLSFGGLRVLNGISLDLPLGMVCGVIGPNGAGKTSLFNCLTGLYLVQSGQISLEGRRIERLAVAERAHLGMSRTFQHVQLSPDLSVIDNVLAGLASGIDTGWISAFVPLRRVGAAMASARQRAMDALRAVGVAHRADDPVSAIPPGTARLVEVARALARKPRVLMLDEPAAGLNSAETAELAQALKGVESPDMAMLIVEHNMDFIKTLCSQVYVLNFGEVIAKGEPAAVMQNPDVIRVYLGEEHSG
jgi:branched-chain amino acid transport system ATP-binding protein